MVEYLRGTIAEVAVKVQDQYPLAFFYQILGGNSDVIKQAKAAGMPRVSMVARWPDQRKALLPGGLQCSPYRITGSSLGTRAGYRIRIEVCTNMAGIFDFFNVLRSMYKAKLLLPTDNPRRW